MYGGQPVKYRGQVRCMFGAWNYVVGSFGLWRSIWVYVWWTELHGMQFWSMEVNSGVMVGNFVYGGRPRCMFGAWNYMVGNFGLCRLIRVYVWCMELDVRQFWSLEVNSKVCLMHGIKWYAFLVCGGQSGCMYSAWN